MNYILKDFFAFKQYISEQAFQIDLIMKGEESKDKTSNQKEKNELG